MTTFLQLSCAYYSNRFHGYLSNPYPLIANADLLLLTSDYEGMPSVLIESITLGTPVVSTDIDYGPREIIQNGYNGYCVEPDDIEKFSDCVIKVLKQRDEFSERARLSSSRYHLQNHIQAYFQVMGIN